MSVDDHEKDLALARAVRLREQGEAGAARERLLGLAGRYPQDAVIAYQTARVHDVLGLEAEAVPFYERALAGRAWPARTGTGRSSGWGARTGSWGVTRRPRGPCGAGSTPSRRTRRSGRSWP